MAAIHSLYLRENLHRRVERRVLVDRSNPLEALSDTQVHKRFRFRKEGIQFIVNLVEGAITRQTKRSCALPPLLQVLITLRFLASGSFYGVIGDGLPRVAVSSVCRVVWGVIQALLTHFNTFVHFPRQQKLASIKQEFYSIAGFPNVIGLIDGTQIPIVAPMENENDFVNRKGVHALNCQMVCDPWMRFTNCVAKWPGSVHDSRIFRESTLGMELQAGVHKGLLLGDSGYPCRKYLMVPYPHPNGRHEIKFNASHVKTRVLIEQCFGVLKRKFACLNKLRVSPEKACRIVSVTVMLHNIAVDFHDIDDEGEIEIIQEDNVYVGDDREQGRFVRNEIANTYFT